MNFIIWGYKDGPVRVRRPIPF